MIIKWDWISDLEIFEIHQEINWKSSQQYQNTEIDTLKSEKQDPSNRTEPQSNYNRNNTHPNHTEQSLTQKGKNEYRVYKENYVWMKEDFITIAKKTRLENKNSRQKLNE